MKLRLFEEWELHRSVMVQMPTGTGKTHLLAAIVREFLCGSGSRVWIVAHRRELVEQIEETVSRYGMGREDGSVRVMSIQWLSRNRKIVNGQPDLIVIDEAMSIILRIASASSSVSLVFCINAAINAGSEPAKVASTYFLLCKE